jgi:glutathione reductase (NADPH)
MAAGFGARVAVAEASRLGGTCVNLGCVPKKLMVYASSFSSAFEDAAGFGWSVTEPSFDWAALKTNRDRELGRLNAVYRELLEGAGVRIIEGRAHLRDRHTVEVGGESFSADRILIATGSRPVRVPIPGAELAITSDELFDLDHQPRSVLIAGGGYIAVEFASILRGLGSEVVLSYRGPLFLRGFDDDVRSTLASEMRKRGVALRFGTTVERLERHDGRVAAVLSSGEVVAADLVLWATGRTPNTAGLGLEELGVRLDARGAVFVDERLQSSVPGIYALGDVIDRITLTPVALAEGTALARSLFGGTPTAVDYSNVPTAVFSQPAVAAVGLSEAAARAAGHDVAVFRSTFRPLLHRLSGRDEQTMMKLVVDRASDRVLGVHMVGPEAGEIVQGLAVALKSGATKASFDATIGIHPTAAEEFVTMRTPVG